MITGNKTLISAGAMVGSLTSKGIHMNVSNNVSIINGAVQAVFSGSPAGTIKLQISCDNVAENLTVGQDPASNVVNWADYSGSPQVISGAGIFIWNFFNPGYRWLRVVWTPTSGTGSLTAIIVVKGNKYG